MRRTKTIAWVVAGSEVAIFAATVVFAALSEASFVQRPEGSPGFATIVVLFVPVLAYPIFGALIASRHPSNPIGWLCLTVGALWFVGGFQNAYAEYGLLARPGAVPGAAIVGALSVSLPAVGVLGTFLLLLFPDGHLPSSRWRVVGWMSGIGIVALTVVLVFSTRTVGWLSGTHNPFLPSPDVLAVLDVLTGVLYIVLFVSIASSVASLFLRYRRASIGERQKLKWIAFAGAVFIVLLGVSLGAWQVPRPTIAVKLLQSAFGPALALIPAAAMFAVLRYRLYDIDRIIGRTVTYSLVSGMLAAAYLGLVVLLQGVSEPVSGGSDLAVAVSTLVVAAAFVPLRRRVQNRVDRRFNRAQYDAAQTIDAFSVRLRQQIDIDALKADLQSLVSQTMEPSHLSCWTPDREPYSGSQSSR